jgi:hypothetical protein
MRNQQQGVARAALAQAGDDLIRLGEVEFDIYDADFPICYSWGRAAQLVENRQPPRFGEGMFRHLTEVADFGRHIERCETTPHELRDDDEVARPRLRLHFDRRSHARLRQLIDALNDATPD